MAIYLLGLDSSGPASAAVEHGANLDKLCSSGTRDVQPGWYEALVLDDLIGLQFRLQLL